MVAQKIRHSSRWPHLSVELTRNEQGHVYAAFRFGAIHETYRLADGRAYSVDCSDRYTWDGPMGRHVSTTARAFAAKLTTRKAA